MLKVFLVEDEFVMREGIKNNIDWASHGYEFCGEAGDGEVAYPMIQKCKPDIFLKKHFPRNSTYRPPFFIRSIFQSNPSYK